MTVLFRLLAGVLLSAAAAAPRRLRVPDPPYLGPAAHVSAGNNRPITRVVIHMTVSPCRPGQARAVAAYFRSEASGGSAHYIVDPAEEVQSVWDREVAQHAPPNPGSLGIELCGYPSSTSDADWMVPADQRHGKIPIWRWLAKDHRSMLNLAARRTAQILVDEGLPPKFLSAAQLRANPRALGITTHANVSAAFGQSTHWDPGLWPRQLFMARVRKHYRRLSA